MRPAPLPPASPQAGICPASAVDLGLARQTSTGGNHNCEVHNCPEVTLPRRRPIRFITDRTLRSQVFPVSKNRSMERLIRVRVPPIPIFPLLFPVGMRIFVVVPVIVCQEYSPCMTLVVVPVVIVLMIPIVNPYLHALLRHRRGHH